LNRFAYNTSKTAEELQTLMASEVDASNAIERKVTRQE
jgi:hypothetical protein